eukprot:COSAG06_NODE_5186_length_3650_cov_2.878941_5_plen_191_part_00
MLSTVSCPPVAVGGAVSDRVAAAAPVRLACASRSLGRLALVAPTCLPAAAGATAVMTLQRPKPKEAKPAVAVPAREVPLTAALRQWQLSILAMAELPGRDGVRCRPYVAKLSSMIENKCEEVTRLIDAYHAAHPHEIINANNSSNNNTLVSDDDILVDTSAVSRGGGNRGGGGKGAKKKKKASKKKKKKK